MSIIGSLVVAVVAAWVAASLALQRFFRERWWERKVEAYTELLVALHDLAEWPGSLADEPLKAAPLTNEEVAALETRFREGQVKVRRAAALGSFVISERAVEILQNVAPAEEMPGSTRMRAAEMEVYRLLAIFDLVLDRKGGDYRMVPEVRDAAEAVMAAVEKHSLRRGRASKEFRQSFDALIAALTEGFERGTLTPDARRLIAAASRALANQPGADGWTLARVSFFAEDPTPRVLDALAKLATFRATLEALREEAKRDLRLNRWSIGELARRGRLFIGRLVTGGTGGGEASTARGRR